MENYIERVRNAFRRTVDRITGQHVPVRTDVAPIENLGERQLLVPPVDVLENDAEVMIRADTPGAFPDNTSVYWDERSGLSVHVQRGSEASGDWLWGENLNGDWYRAFRLPDYLEGDQARAKVSEGVLTIQIPKRDTPAPVGIPVTAT